MFLLFLLLSLRISLVVYSEFVQVERSNNIHATFEMVSTLPPIYHQHSNFWLNLNCQNTSCDICKIFKDNNHSCHVASKRAINIKYQTISDVWVVTIASLRIENFSRSFFMLEEMKRYWDLIAFWPSRAGAREALLVSLSSFADDKFSLWLL